MKKIFLTVFTAVFALMTFALVASAAPTCGVPDTEGLPTCSTVSKTNEKCCIPPHYRGVKTVVKSGQKTSANNLVSASAEVASTNAVANQQLSYAPAPNQVTANVISVTEVVPPAPVAAQQASGSGAPAVASSAVKAVKSASSSVKTSK